MSDPNPTPPQPAPGDPDLGDAGKRALAAERARATTAEQQLRAAQTQLEQATHRVTELEHANQQLTTTVADRDLQVARLGVGIDAGLPRTLIDRLQGADTAALTADAEALKALIPQPSGPTGPRPDPSMGPKSSPATPEQAFAALMGPLLT